MPIAGEGDDMRLSPTARPGQVRLCRHRAHSRRAPLTRRVPIVQYRARVLLLNSSQILTEGVVVIFLPRPPLGRNLILPWS